MVRVPRPESEHIDQIQQQLRLLIDAATRYDDGGPHADDEALNMAVRLRTLLHTTENSRAAMKPYLGALKIADFFAAAPTGTAPHISYLQQEVAIRDQPGVRFRAPLNAVQRALPPSAQARALFEAPTFDEWWAAVVLRDLNGHEFTRQVIVLAVANQDGGAHVDNKIESDYFTISRDGAQFGMSITLDDGSMYAAGSPIAAAIRQITWEFTSALRREYPDLMEDYEG